MDIVIESMFFFLSKVRFHFQSAFDQIGIYRNKPVLGQIIKCWVMNMKTTFDIECKMIIAS